MTTLRQRPTPSAKCPGCGHDRSFHDEMGCWYAPTGSTEVCACAVPVGQPSAESAPTPLRLGVRGTRLIPGALMIVDERDGSPILDGVDEDEARRFVARYTVLPVGAGGRAEPREVLDDPAESAYYNARTCICGEDAGAHIHPGCEGFDPDWDAIRFRDAGMPASGVVDALDAYLDSHAPDVPARPSVPEGSEGPGEQAEGEAGGLTMRDVAKLLASQGARMIAAERVRQTSHEGWTPEHDDAHTNGILAVAAAELAAYPWDVNHPHERDHCGSLAKHRKNPLRRLAIAGALIAAEIDRLLRTEADR